MAAVREARNMAFVLGTLITILFLIHQSLKFFKSSFRQSVRLKIDGSELDSVASSANRSSIQVCFDNGKSFVYTRKNKGPRTEPWGTPADICCGSDSLPEIFTCWERLVKFD